MTELELRCFSNNSMRFSVKIFKEGKFFLKLYFLNNGLAMFFLFLRIFFFFFIILFSIFIQSKLKISVFEFCKIMGF